MTTSTVSTTIPSTTLTHHKMTPEQMSKQPRLMINVVCPGSNFSERFLASWTKLLSWAKGTNIDFTLVTATGSNISHVRETSLGGDINGPADQKLFGGNPYNYILFCDSDQVFEPGDVDKLLRANKDIICGCIKMVDGNYSIGWYDREVFRKTQTTYRLVDCILDSIDEPFRISLLGCGFTLVKSGIIERLSFPWFYPLKYPEPLVGYLGEDMSLFSRIMDLGYKCWCHPKVRIGHEKKMVLM